MNLEDTLARSLHEHLDGVATPVVDVGAVRRSGQRRRSAATAAGIVTALAVLVGGVALATAGTDRASVVRPTRLPGMEFDQGLRAYYDDAKRELHVGGRAVDIGRVTGLDTSASATPYGVVFFSGDQEVWLVEEDGRVRRLAAGVGSSDFHPTVKFDAQRPLAAWLTRDGDRIRLTVFGFGEQEGIVGTAEVPCDGDGCDYTAMAGVDRGRVLVRLVGDRPRTLVYDVADLAAAPAVVDGFRAADVRNGVVLGEGRAPAGDPLGEGWRFVPAQGPESLLTFDGGHEVYWSSRLRSTDGGPPLRLDVPVDGTEFVAVDSDGSVMVAVLERRGKRFFDCTVPDGRCAPIGRLGPAGGDPMFLGADM